MQHPPSISPPYQQHVPSHPQGYVYSTQPAAYPNPPPTYPPPTYYHCAPTVHAHEIPHGFSQKPTNKTEEELLCEWAAAPYVPEQWLDKVKWCVSTGDYAALKKLRKAIIVQTLYVIKTRSFVTPDQKTIELGALLDKQQNQPQMNYLYDNNFVATFWRQGLRPNFAETFVTVERIDTLDMAHKMKSLGFNPVVLNMASATSPGGGYKNGAGAQEENLFRRSNYCEFLDQEESRYLYPIPTTGGVYSSNVLVFRGNEQEGYRFIQPFYTSCIAVAAINKPLLDHSGSRLSYSAAATTKDKLRAILAIGAIHNHDSIILGAFGCGAFANPPEHVAELMREVIQEFAGYYRVIAVAILEDHNSTRNRGGNFRPFYDCLNRSFSKM